MKGAEVTRSRLASTNPCSEDIVVERTGQEGTLLSFEIVWGELILRIPDPPPDFGDNKRPKGGVLFLCTISIAVALSLTDVQIKANDLEADGSK